MKKIQNFWEDPEFQEKELKQDRLDYEEKIKDKVSYDISGNGEAPINRNDLSRNCPRCAGRLKVKENTSKDYLLLYCKSCRIEVFAEDIDYPGELQDKIYRTIPSSTILYWEKFRKEQRK